MKIIKLSATDSTNTFLAQLVRRGEAIDNIIVVAEHQKKGRGQRASVWQSQPFKSLTFSVFKRVSGLSAEQQFAISAAVSVAIVTYLNKMVTTAIQIKWPNDIMAAGKKCGGILIENQVRSTAINSTIIGVGLNVNEIIFNNLPQATSLRLATGEIFNLDELLIGISSEIFSILNLLDENNIALNHKTYEQLLFKKGEMSKYRLPDGEEITGKITGVNSSGQLLMDLPDGRSLKFWNKEIEMLY